MEPTILTFHEPVTGTWQYIVADPVTRDGVVIDSVLDYNKETGVIDTATADKLLEAIREHKFTISHILETHAHADHLTASRYLQSQLAEPQKGSRPSVCIGQGITKVQQTMGQIYGIAATEMQQAFDQTFFDGEHFQVGNIQATVVYLPGHTPDHIGYIIGSNIFTGDSIFNPDLGSARCDFPGGSAIDLYESMQKLLAFPGHFKLYTGHDYPPKDRSVEGGSPGTAVPYTTVEVQAKENKHVRSGTPMDQFVRMREDRDATLSEPKLLRQSMHVNVRGGKLPAGMVEGFKIDQKPSSVPVAVA